jgi:hypothetical protein
MELRGIVRTELKFLLTLEPIYIHESWGKSNANLEKILKKFPFIFTKELKKCLSYIDPNIP